MTRIVTRPSPLGRWRGPVRGPSARYVPMLVALALGCGDPATEEQGAATPAEADPAKAARAAKAVRDDLPDVLLITLDTTRADRIGAYGYADAKTDTIDALAAKGRRYDRAYSPLPLTIPSHASIFTGQYPPNHGIRANGDAVLSDDANTLTERLAEAGYHTGASVAAFVTTRTWGFGQGFDAYFDEVPTGQDFWHGERPGADVVDDLLAWRAELPDDGRPVFAWAHLYDPHYPYVPSEPWRSASEGRPYDGEIAYVDDQIERLLESFAGRPTLVVVVGDHGEGLGQHGELTHGLYTWDSTQRVPFIISGPGVEAAVVEEPVSLVDLAPTVLSLLELPALPSADGRVVPGDPAEPVYMESWQLAQRFGISPHLAVVSGDYKLFDLPRPELYDISGADPGEQSDLSAQQPDRVKELAAALEAFGFQPPTADPAHPTSPDVAAQLQALGYTDGTFTGDLSGPLPDPKDNAELLATVQKVEHMGLQQAKPEEVLPLVEKLATEHPEITEFHNKWANMLARMGKADEALSILDRALAQDPDNAMLKHSKATMLARVGRPEEASVLFQEAAEAMPFAPRIRTMAVAALLDSPDGSNKGIELGLHYLSEHPDDYNVAGLLGVELVRRGQFARGLELLETGILASRPEREVAMQLAAARQGQGRTQEARSLLESEIEHHPTNLDAIVSLLRIQGHMGDWDAQVELSGRYLDGLTRLRERAAKEGVDLPPPPPGLLAEIWHLRSQALFNLKRYDEARVALDAGLEVDEDYSMLLLLDANLLKQEGSPDKAKARFEEAKAAKARENEAAEKKRAAAMGGAVPGGAPPAGGRPPVPAGGAPPEPTAGKPR